jgi:hypothetical protein
MFNVSVAASIVMYHRFEQLHSHSQHRGIQNDDGSSSSGSSSSSSGSSNLGQPTDIPEPHGTSWVGLGTALSVLMLVAFANRSRK